ncbi:hypothetical protein TPAR_07714 [Tolypocladium paradoxum]|uniref:Uncharacterized protein n=1 Tax=Tolypocladium paradoxum TaxID=94208 RepID=A0A2S4KPF7_9HYPO|nr:hypothetical protein TPAR_07714 [Tolypocladium paradoxum]
MTRFPFTAGAAKEQRRWDPRPLPGLANPNRGYETCAGEAYSPGRRCRRVIRVIRVADANRAFEKLAKLAPFCSLCSRRT